MGCFDPYTDTTRQTERGVSVYDFCSCATASPWYDIPATTCARSGFSALFDDDDGVACCEEITVPEHSERAAGEGIHGSAVACTARCGVCCGDETRDDTGGESWEDVIPRLW